MPYSALLLHSAAPSGSFSPLLGIAYLQQGARSPIFGNNGGESGRGSAVCEWLAPLELRFARDCACPKSGGGARLEGQPRLSSA
ncbi:hypothetical protein ASPWEDRAFT_367907 [Aspergillus wentii DTO 134E9]|uniref:Uncharacterized protein n=1 Tax=Aspergillus wentii DTO 134E9 TaxID=1073089 RepID=A0A1L9RWJ8_ASPWE|nr:uncharacterized protein ASPWEDRAFT_367907 [Aspergillus wentii DTO 134E9]OJJ39306.1 hypothetical protein ASPWEDRAFT_367907 [Aspergillus wentii DTO 134E9]